jgi:integrase
MSTYRERSKGVWEMRVHIGSGRQVSRTFRGGKRNMLSALRELEGEVERGMHRRGAPGTVEAIVFRWLDANRTRWAPKTLANYEGLVEAHIVPYWEGKQARRVKVSDVEAWLAKLLAEGGRRDAEGNPTPLGVVRVRHARVALGAAFREGMRLELLSRNPVALARMPSAPRRESTTRPIPEIIPAIERAADDGHHGFATLVRLAVLTGQRRGALLALRWSDVDLEAGRITVTRAVSRVQGVTHLKDTKTHARGIVSIDERTVEALRRWRTISEAEDAVLGVELDDPFVWHEPDGAPWNPDRVTKRWRELADSVGLVGVRFNDLRHASATTMVAAGVDPRTAATRLQHSPEMLLATYAHHVPEKDRAAAELLAEALDGAS